MSWGGLALALLVAGVVIVLLAELVVIGSPLPPQDDGTASREED